jgi:RNA polymerase sigma-70 factor (ECF subfamily)
MASISDNSDPDKIEEMLGRGDPIVVEELYRLYFERLYSLILYKLGGDREKAEDITQDTFVSAVKSVKSFRQKCKPYTWLVSIAYHKINDHYRAQQRIQNHLGKSVSLDSVESRGAKDLSDSTVDTIESKEQNITVRRVLYALPVDYRIALILKYVEGMSVSEIMEVTGRSNKSVEGLLARARQAFKKIFGAKIE